MEQAFSGIVEEVKRDKSNKPVLMVKIAELSTRFATPIKVPEDVWKGARVGQAMNMVLVRETLKKDKDGSQLWHYYWGYGRPATSEEGVKAQATATVAVASEDRREVNIRRAVALGRAVDFVAGTDAVIDDVLQVAETFDAWLAAEIVQGTSPVPQTEAPKPKPVDGDVTDHSTFWKAVRLLYPDKDMEAVQKIVQPIFGGNLAEWIAAKPENTWAEAFEKVKGE